VEHRDGYFKAEREAFKELIFGNIVKAMKILCAYAIHMDLQFSNVQNVVSANKINNLDDEVLDVLKVWGYPLTTEIIQLWDEPAIQDAYSHRHKFQFVESMGYYMSRFDVLISPDYIPSELDVLCSKAKTTGIVETEIAIGAHVVKLIDTGGQRNERKSKS
jgi:hypothetical protein